MCAVSDRSWAPSQRRLAHVTVACKPAFYMLNFARYALQPRGVVGLATSREGCYKAFTALWRRRAYGSLFNQIPPYDSFFGHGLSKEQDMATL